MVELDDFAVMNPLEPEDEPAVDSGVDEAIDDISSIQSISSSILQYRVKNGRRYTTYGSGEYLLPNDEDEQERLGEFWARLSQNHPANPDFDMTHHIWMLVNDDKLYQTPSRYWKRILDVGTGTGIWAIDVADQHEEAEVLGVDLSPIQPSWLPPNCRFEMDDLEKEWTFKRQFDFIFIRNMIASFQDWPTIFSQAFKNIEPGGYIEVQDNVYPLASDDDTIHNTEILQWSKLMVNAANKTGRSITIAHDFQSMLADAGFVNIVETRKKIPMNVWPKHPQYKELGRWSHYMLHSGLEGISMGLLTGLGLTADEVHILLAKVRKDLLNTKIHGYWHTYLVHAKKPGNGAG